MTEIRYVQVEDQEFWYSLDRHLPQSEFANKVRDKRGYMIAADGRPDAMSVWPFSMDNLNLLILLQCGLQVF